MQSATIYPLEVEVVVTVPKYPGMEVCFTFKNGSHPPIDELARVLCQAIESIVALKLEVKSE